MLLSAFQVHWPDAWPTLEAAGQEVAEALEPERLGFVALSEDREVLGWIGGIPQYDGRVWELHPLAVRPDAQGRGIGRSLVVRLEDEVCRRGGLTMWLGTDDEAGLTSLGGADLYPNVLEKLGSIRNLKAHPFAFYERLGYEVVGVVPDANGFGKPDILMAKRVARQSTP